MEFLEPVALITKGGLVGVSLIIFFESGFAFGFIFPGDSLLFAAGFLSAEGLFSLPVLIPVVAISSALGGLVGYYTGKKLGDRLVTKPSRFVKPEYIERTVAFFARHGTKAVIIARFIPIVRTFLPILAGVGSMKGRTFHLYNIFGAFLWSGSIIMVGYFFGHLIPDLEKFLSPIILVVIGGSLLVPVIGFWKTRKKKV